MSAPVLAEAQLAALVPRPRVEPPLDARPERRRSDPLRRLARRHDALCTQAADASGIARGLRAAGVTDDEARTTYGVGGVDALGAVLFALVPRRGPVPPPPAPVPPSLRLSALRGALYAAPGLLYVLALHLAGGAAAQGLGAGAAALLVATVVGTGLAQCLALLGAGLLQRLEHRAAGQLLRLSVLAGLPLVGGLLVGGGALAGVPVPTGLLAAGQVGLLVTAAALVVVGAERLLLLLLLPGLLTAATALAAPALTGRPLVPVPLQAGGLALTLALVGAAAVRRGPRPVFGGALHRVVTPAELRSALAHGGCATLTTALLSVVVVDVMTGRGPAQPHALAVAMAPLLVGLAVADHLVQGLRSAGRAGLARHTCRDALRSHHRALLLRALARHALVLTGTAVLIGLALVRTASPLDLVLALDTVALCVVGAGLLLCMVLQALDLPGPVLAVTAAALAVDGAVRALPLLRGVLPPGAAAALAPYADLSLAAGHLVAAVLLLARLLPTATREYARATRHA